MNAPDDTDDFEDLREGPSKTRSKRDAEDLKDLGEELVQLPANELDALPLTEKLRDAIDLARRITSKGAAARQRQLIGKILRNVDADELRYVIDQRELTRKLAAREFHRTEVWRDRLLTEGDPAVAALLASAPGLDAVELRSKVTVARREAAAGRPPAASRELFRWLREALAATGTNA